MSPTPTGAQAGPTRRTVLLQGGVYTASRVLNGGVVFLLMPLYAHYLGSAGVGVVEVMNVARSFLTVLLTQGLDSAWFRLRFDYGGERLRRFESTLVWYILASSLSGIAALFALGPVIGPVLTPGVPFVPLGMWTALAAAATTFGTLLERRYQSEQRPSAFAVWSLARTLLGLLGILGFVVLLGRGAAGKIEGEALASALGAAVALWILRPAPLVSQEDLRHALAYGLPLVPHAFAALVNDLADRFFLNAHGGLRAVGVYSMGYRLAGVGMLVTVAVNQALAPAFIEVVRKAEAADAAGDERGAARYRTHVASLGFVGVLVACLVAEAVTAGTRELLLFTTTPEFSDSWEVVAPVSAGVIFWSWYATLSRSIAYRAETVKRLPLITIAAALVNVAANAALVPRFGIMGAAWATAGSNAVMAIGGYAVGTRVMELPYAFRRWSLVTGLSLAGLAVSFAFDALVADTKLRIAGKTTCVALSWFATVALSGIPFASIRSALRRNPAAAPPPPALPGPG